MHLPNARFLEDLVNDAVAANPAVRHVILECPAVNTIDVSGLESLDPINRRLKNGGITSSSRLNALAAGCVPPDVEGTMMPAAWHHLEPSRQAARRVLSGALRALPLVLLIVGALPAAAGDLETQAWANFTMGWNRSEKVYLELDLEPKVLVSGEPGWRNLDVTPAVEYYPSSGIDLTGEATVGTTMQTDDLRTNELTLRAGLRLYLFKNMRERFDHEHKLPGRVLFATLFRVEERNFWYSDETESQHSFRFRVRLELKAPINHADLTKDKTYYVLGDIEAYAPIGEEVEERFATKYRLRLGLGYRINARQRGDLLYMRDRVRNTIEDTPSDSVQILDLRYRVVF